MKMIMAIIRPSKLEQVRKALTEIGIEGMTYSEVSGLGRQKGHTEIYRGAEYEINFVPKIKLEIIISDEQLDAAVNTIRESVSTGKIGDGKIFVFDVGTAIRIRTGETDAEAI